MREELIKYLNDYGVSQTWVAKQIGVSIQMVSLYLKGDRNLSEGNQVKLRQLLDRFNKREI